MLTTILNGAVGNPETEQAQRKFHAALQPGS